jgi:Mg2+/Co2+ transporter CorB
MQEYRRVINYINHIATLDNVHEFEDVTFTADDIKFNTQKFLVWFNRKDVQSWEEIQGFATLKKYKRLPVYVNNYDADVLFLPTENIIRCLNKESEEINVNFNVLNSGFIPELKAPSVLARNIDDVKQNYWVEFPRYTYL